MRGALNKQAGGGRTTGHASANRRGAASGQHPRAYPQTVHVVLATRPTVMSRPPTTRGRNLRLGRPTAAAQGQPPTAPGNKRAASRARRRCPTHRLAACTTATAREHSPPAVKRSRRGRRPPTPLPRVRGASTTARGGDKKSPPAPGVDPRGGSARQTHTGARLQGKKKKTESRLYLEAGTGQQRSSTTNASPHGGAPPPPPCSRYNHLLQPTTRTAHRPDTTERRGERGAPKGRSKGRGQHTDSSMLAKRAGAVTGGRSWPQARPGKRARAAPAGSTTARRRRRRRRGASSTANAPQREEKKKCDCRRGSAVRV